MKYQSPVEMFTAHFRDFKETGDGTYRDGINFAATALLTLLGTCYGGDERQIVAHLKALAKGVEDSIDDFPDISASVH